MIEVYSKFKNTDDWIFHRLMVMIHPSILEHMITSTDPNIRATVAKYGSKEVQERLLHDEGPFVRGNLAWYGTYELSQQLINDENYMVAWTANRRIA